ncbi:unnamed protein product (macronuclear) [Paramecium tetraurelia]|uniref:CHCH domain-containing protein n=1 Tax=Paramecium tetraurelia TaxID=5888 RepID=A0CWQ8_PARTE|nr:uncharacterized protein GSPATT00001428001 [Paramecium tetraurelia]CAK75225.1 unnamed protein product [Paramecium tetraurelia]|eukprot:XP_001442622.1 hypothetical protein (macronuclear) [Paramecium tetraurelia strain d4-2]
MSIDQILKDQEQEWWQAGKEDDYNVLNKIQRTSCRPIQRKYLECLKQNFDEQMVCDQFKKDKDNCLNILQYMKIKEIQKKLIK